MRRRPRFVLLGALAALGLLVPAAASADVQPKIVGGSTASISQYPWQAALVISPSKLSGDAHDRQFCGGSLLTSRIVITAAHCIYDTDPDNGSQLDPSDVDVVLGRTTLSDSAEGVEAHVKAVSYRANYDPDYLGEGVPRFDVGYLVLSQPSSRHRIQIAGSNESSLWAPGVMADISGWGCTQEPNFLLGCSTSDNLRAAKVPIIADSSCGSNSVYGAAFEARTMVCAGFLSGGVDTCNGDSGGPLQAPVAGGGYRLVGITGWGDGCAEANAPGVYTRVAGSTMHPLIESDVCSLESRNGLADEAIFGSGAQPCGTGSSSGGTSSAASGEAQSFNSAKAPFNSAKALKKCKRIHKKKKRRRCVKKVKAKARARA